MRRLSTSEACVSSFAISPLSTELSLLILPDDSHVRLDRRRRSSIAPAKVGVPNPVPPGPIPVLLLIVDSFAEPVVDERICLHLDVHCRELFHSPFEHLGSGLPSFRQSVPSSLSVHGRF